MPRSTADLDAPTTLALLEGGVVRRREAEVDDLLLCLRWADLHANDPRDDDELRAVVPGGERLCVLGGDGTPGVRELSVCELGIARGVHTNAARAVLADALDLRHRLPLTFARVRELEAEVWVARKVAALSRHLAEQVVHVVDTAVAAAIGGHSPARVLELAAAKVIEADQATHDARVAAERVRRFVALSRSDGSGLRTVIARVTTADAHWVDATVARVAELLATDPTYADTGADELRAIAFGQLARPAELLARLVEAEQAAPTDPHTARGATGVSRATAMPADLLDALRHLDLRALRPRAVLYLHLHEAALAGQPGTARVEGLAPESQTALRELLARTELVVKPVLDVAELISTAAYEHPEAIKEHIHLRRPGDRFPHATRTSRALDIDHVVPHRHGPPGQTSTHQGQPLSRTAHRAKTHLGYRCETTEAGAVIWRTPHGRHRVVDAAGTYPITAQEAHDWVSDDPLDRALTHLLHQARTGRL